MKLYEALDQVLEDTKLPPHEQVDDTQPDLSWHARARLYFALLLEARRRVRMLSKSVSFLDLPLDLEYHGSPRGYDARLVLEESFSGQGPVGRGLAANLALRQIECRACGMPLDYVGGLRAWTCTNAHCAACTPTRRPEPGGRTRDELLAWLWGRGEAR